jgi:hypothetical protein
MYRRATTHQPPKPAGRQFWREPDDEFDDEAAEASAHNGPGDRDDRALRSATRRAAGREHLTPGTPGGHRDRAWGGALRRMTVGGVTPSREDEHRLLTVPGRYVPVGFARYVAPLVDPYDYEYYRLAGWRVAVPRTIPGTRVRDLLYRIYYYGPQSAGYVRLGDTMVPAILDTGDRMTLGETAVEYEPYPLSP